MKRALTIAVHALGVVSFVYPFVLPSRGGAVAHAADAPYLFSALSLLLVGLAVADVRSGASDARRVAMLGVLVGVNAMLRLPGALGGASLMFLLPILCGYVLGARFGFLLGSLSFAASALITGGVGPWLPFQMWALGWVGAGGALVGRLRARGRVAVVALAAYGWFAGYAFGALLNLWFWPFQQGGGPLAWAPGLGPGDTLERYARFYMVTSFAWDSSRAIGNAVLVATLGAPVVRLLARYRARTETTWVDRRPAEDVGAAPVAVGTMAP